MTTQKYRYIRYKVLDALGILADALGPIAARMLMGSGIRSYDANGRSSPVDNLLNTHDASQVLSALRANWREVFAPLFQHSESQRVRSLVYQVSDVRNKYEGHPHGDYRYADEALMDIRRLLEAFSADTAAQQVNGLKQELARLMLADVYATQDPYRSKPDRLATISRTNNANVSGKDSESIAKRGPIAEQTVRYAFEQHLQVGQTLPTPSGKGSFSITSIDDGGIRVDKIKGVHIKWPALEGIVPYLLGKHNVKIGAKKDVNGEPGTLDAYLKDKVSPTMTASYVAAMLEQAGVVEYVHQRPMGVKLAQPPTNDGATQCPPTP